MNEEQRKELDANLNKERFDDCEWCFQFDDEEPQVFAWTEEGMKNENPSVEFKIENMEGANITFSSESGKRFSLFARKLSESGRQLRLQSKQLQQKILEEKLKNE